MFIPRRLTLVRHGETVGESSIRYHGANDIALSALGLEQMRCAGASLREQTFDRVFTSTLQRSRVGAEIIAPQVRATPLAGFDEINFGDWEGLTREEIRERDPARYDAWQAAMATFQYPNGDSVPAFRQRVIDTFAELQPQMVGHTLIVAHKGIVSTILGRLKGQSIHASGKPPIDLGSIHVAEEQPDGWQVVVENQTSHLPTT